MQKEFPAKWQGQVQLYTASIDADHQQATKTIKRRKLDAVTHLWCEGASPRETGYNSVAAKTLGLRPMPDSFLIDRDGTILFRGHPDFFEDDVLPLIEARLR